MASIFHKKEQRKRNRDKHQSRPKIQRERPRQVSDHDLVDPIMYNGDLDVIKYPVLEPKKTETQEFEPENPLNTRR